MNPIYCGLVSFNLLMDFEVVGIIYGARKKAYGLPLTFTTP